ncbi:MAG: response regulator [Aureliella sp.]
MNTLKRVLIVDDDEAIRKSLARILQLNSFETAEAADGKAALDMIQQQVPDLVILDIRMPGIDGIETFVRIREQLPNVPAIFMSAYSANDRAKAADALGGLSVLAKPFKIDSMLDLAKSAIHIAPILIVDDNPDVLNSLARALSQAGIESTKAESLRAATAQLRKRPDRVVIADVFLDDGFGFDLLQEYTGKAKKPPLILVTGYGERLGKTLDQRGLSGHKLTCLNKPVDIDSLIRTIRQHQGNSEGAAP